MYGGRWTDDLSVVLPADQVDSSDSHINRKIKNVLHFSSMTLQNSLNTFGGVEYKMLQASSIAQDQLHALASSVKSQLGEIENRLVVSQHQQIVRVFISWLITTGLFLALLFALNLVSDLKLIGLFALCQLVAFLIAIFAIK